MSWGHCLLIRWKHVRRQPLALHRIRVNDVIRIEDRPSYLNDVEHVADVTQTQYTAL